MKICSLYGAGFYYMPGTDMCIKIGGWMRAEVTDESNGSLKWGPYSANTNTLATNMLAVRARGYITADAREETAYGVARAYIAVGLSTNTVGNNLDGPSNTFNSNRAFVQWAGFTAGLARSYFDFYNAAVYNYRAGYLPIEDTGDGGWWVWAYTAQFGGGVSATLSAESRRTVQIDGQDAVGSLVTGASGLIEGSLTTTTNGAGYGGFQVPDIVANLRVDQAWGSAQIMGALHEDNALYYDGTGVGAEITGHPSTAWGWAVGAGLHVNLPALGPGDNIEGEVHATEGALNYINNPSATNFDYVQGATQAYGIQTDCVYGGLITGALGTGCQLTTAWGFDLAYEHYWTPQLHQDIAGGYMNVSYAQGIGSANSMLCAAEGVGAGVGAAAVAIPGCNNNWSYWGVGSRLQWDVTKSFYIGVEALYTELDSAQSGLPGNLVPSPAGLGGPTFCSVLTLCSIKDEGNWAFTLRMHKDFLP